MRGKQFDAVVRVRKDREFTEHGHVVRQISEAYKQLVRKLVDKEEGTIPITLPAS